MISDGCVIYFAIQKCMVKKRRPVSVETRPSHSRQAPAESRARWHVEVLDRDSRGTWSTLRDLCIFYGCHLDGYVTRACTCVLAGGLLAKVIYETMYETSENRSRDPRFHGSQTRYHILCITEEIKNMTSTTPSDRGDNKHNWNKLFPVTFWNKIKVFYCTV